jgi:hypothetical protein
MPLNNIHSWWLEYKKEQVHGHGRGREQSELLGGLENMRVSGDLGSPTLETSPYYEYALSALDDLDGKTS